MKLPDPDIQTGPWETVKDGMQRNLDALGLAMIGTGGKSVEIRFGAATLTFMASTDSDLPAITHGLGRTPVVVVATPFNVTSGFARIPVVTWFGSTATTFQLAGRSSTAWTGTADISWIAIG